MPSLDEEISRNAEKQQAQQLESLKQQQKNQGLKGAAYNRAGQKGADMVQKAAGKLGGGSEAALVGAVSGALKGEGVGGVVRSALSSWVLWVAFGFIGFGVITSPTIAGILFAVVAIIYLDFHFIMNKFGSKFFGPMNRPQKVTLAAAHGVVLIIPILFIAIYFTVTSCTYTADFATASRLTGFTNMANLVDWYSRENCNTDSIQVPVSTPTADADIDIVLTSAYRPGAIVFGTNRLSAHGRGEAIDVALRNPRVGFRPNPPDARIAQVVSIARSIIGGRGDVIDEYNNSQCNPAEASCAGHIHIEFNSGQCDGTVFTTTSGPPTDLQSLNGIVPIEGASDPRVRTCMLQIATELFERVGVPIY
jgi:hypothetical protein